MHSRSPTRQTFGFSIFHTRARATEPAVRSGMLDSSRMSCRARSGGSPVARRRSNVSLRQLVHLVALFAFARCSQAGLSDAAVAQLFAGDDMITVPEVLTPRNFGAAHLARVGLNTQLPSSSKFCTGGRLCYIFAFEPVSASVRQGILCLAAQHC